MGLHQDKDECERIDRRGLPVVSVSIGDTARFLFGGTPRRDAGANALAARQATRSSSAVPRACAITACRGSFRTRHRPSSDSTGRFNLTFRQRC